nr:hypothetical protein [Bacteroidota bacterium]
MLHFLVFLNSEVRRLKRDAIPGSFKAGRHSIPKIPSRMDDDIIWRDGIPAVALACCLS